MTCLVDMKIPGYDHVVFNHQERNLGSLIDMLKLLLRNLGSLVDMKIPRYVAAKLLLLLADIRPKKDYSDHQNGSRTMPVFLW
jgi:hypothetical protein